jgi:hypothetical protein
MLVKTVTFNLVSMGFFDFFVYVSFAMYVDKWLVEALVGVLNAKSAFAIMSFSTIIDGN